MNNFPRRKTMLCIVLVALFAPASAQLTIQGGVGGGVAVPAADFGGSTVDYYVGSKYGFATGYNAHGKVRIGALGVRVTGFLDYSSFNNSGNSEPGTGTVEVKSTILAFRFGPEYAFSLPFAPLTPYLGARAGINIINGEMTFRGVPRVPSGTYKLQSGVRIGIGGTVGVAYAVAPFVSLDAAAHYDAINMLGKLWENFRTTEDNRLGSYLALNDEPDPLYEPGSDRHFVGKTRSINTMHFTVTVMFGL
ncbi:MAG TPA: outer membrane beta-barrel protein [Bacteroidota bacterium]